MSPGLLESLWYFDIHVSTSKGRSNGPAISLGRGEGESLCCYCLFQTQSVKANDASIVAHMGES